MHASTAGIGIRPAPGAEAVSKASCTLAKVPSWRAAVAAARYVDGRLVPPRPTPFRYSQPGAG
ncbi:hypothetical protein GCM10010399_14930 [Dactylosporangium fulvum]